MARGSAERAAALSQQPSWCARPLAEKHRHPHFFRFARHGSLSKNGEHHNGCQRSFPSRTFMLSKDCPSPKDGKSGLETLESARLFKETDLGTVSGALQQPMLVSLVTVLSFERHSTWPVTLLLASVRQNGCMSLTRDASQSLVDSTHTLVASQVCRYPCCACLNPTFIAHAPFSWFWEPCVSRCLHSVKPGVLKHGCKVTSTPFPNGCQSRP